ncbi:peptidase inhibitor family I36 protein [Streptomyces sp. ALI-76-A]|uniref:peptidase inhibitor family I36 protein n=1 Tax=Streptomyces sp. ALI-76-A TaxID=3025736 RepID=UPI00256EA04A|nr:peptidase inhibitor family I36 protein [Streptomyces sp. ALI-76-A]MDL5206050.1 peptidase inhibitor family I36 protein [Streptomyces sp. ALI-76-A]
MPKPIGRALSTTVAAVAAVTALGTAVASPAMADSRDCPANAFCAWDNSSYNGRLIHSNAGQSVSNVGFYFNDKLTSYWNRTNHWVSLYAHAGYGDCLVSIRPVQGSPPSAYTIDGRPHDTHPAHYAGPARTAPQQPSDGR